MRRPLFISSVELSEYIDPEDFVEAVRDGYRQHGEGAPTEPRTKLTAEEPPGNLMAYIAILPDTGGMGGFTYSLGFREQETWLMTPLFDANTGEPIAIIDGAWMSPFKTGAAGAVAIDMLARSNARTLGLIGSGRQARGQLLAAESVRDIDQVSVYSPTKSNRVEFALEFDQRLDANITAVDTPREAVEDADIVITATSSPSPVFDGDHLQDGTHISAVGQFDPNKRELDVKTIAQSIYVPDLRSRTKVDAGSFIAAMEAGAITDADIHAELGEVVAGDATGRKNEKEITVFDSGGTAIETVAAAYLVYEEAVKRGIGTDLEFVPASSISL